MEPRSALGFFLLLVTVIGCGVTALAMQWRRSMALRDELERVKYKAGEFVRLREESQRLRTKQIPVAELGGLSADHAAVARIRAELKAPQKNAPATR